MDNWITQGIKINAIGRRQIWEVTGRCAGSGDWLLKAIDSNRTRRLTQHSADRRWARSDR